MTVCYIALGGNVGDVRATMERGLSLLHDREGVHVTAVSPVYETVPVGPSAGTAFLNAAARLECDVEPHDLLRHLQETEDRAGRRREGRWQARPLDLDLLLYGEAVLSDPVLTVPHPHLWYRRFVLDPLADIAADVVHPVFGDTIQELRDRLLPRPLPVTLSGGTPQERNALARQLQERVSAAAVVSAEGRDHHGRSSEPAGAITLDITPHPVGHGAAEPSDNRVVRLALLPGTLLEAAESVLTATLDQPQSL